MLVKTLTIEDGVKGEKHTFKIEARNDLGYNSYLWDKNYSDLLQTFQISIPATVTTGTVTQVNENWRDAADAGTADLPLNNIEF